MRLARPLESLIEQLMKLPSIGPKSAQRMALFILKLPEAEAVQIARSIIEARNKIFPCSHCGYLTEHDPCPICQDENRDRTVLCVVQEATNIIAIERTGFRGIYFVLKNDHQLMGNMAFDNKEISVLTDKLANHEVKEMVLALNPDIEGEIMSRFLAGIASKYAVKATRLAHGLPVGGDIEFADEITLRKAFEGRTEI